MDDLLLHARAEAASGQGPTLDPEGKKARRQRGQLATRCFQATSPRVVVSTRGSSGAFRAAPPQTGHSPSSSSGQSSACSWTLISMSCRAISSPSAPAMVFQLRELGASRQAVGVKLLGQFPSHLAQAVVKFRSESRQRPCPSSQSSPSCRVESGESPATSIGKIASAPLAMQTMSCALRPLILILDLASSPIVSDNGSFAGRPPWAGVSGEPGGTRAMGVCEPGQGGNAAAISNTFMCPGEPPRLSRPPVTPGGRRGEAGDESSVTDEWSPCTCRHAERPARTSTTGKKVTRSRLAARSRNSRARTQRALPGRCPTGSAPPVPATLRRAITR